MSRLPTHWSMLVVVLALAAMVGCQGFSSAKPNSQNTPQNLPGTLTAAPASVSFGNVQIGTSQTASETLSNTGGSNLTVTQLVATGSGFSTAGLSLPVTLTPGQSVAFSVIFSPSAAGLASGSLALTNDGSNSPLNVALSGTGVAAGSLTENPTSFSFGSVQVGASQTQTETLKNSGAESLTISQVTAAGAGFSYTGLTLPLTLAPNQSSTFGVAFTPKTAGVVSGDLSITLSGSSNTLDIALSGTGVTPATLSATPTSLTFTGVQSGKTQTQTETVQNTGGASATISQGTVAGTGFSISGLSAPVILAPGQSTSFSVTFSPASSGSFSGSVAIASNASNPNLNIPLSGSATGPAQGQLGISPGTISVGNVTVGTSGTQVGTLSATVSSVTVSSVSVGSAEFAISGISFPVTLAAGQSVNFTVTFTPTASGVASVAASFNSNASNSPTSVTITGTGVAAPVHSVSLLWTGSSSPNVIGYNVYRRTGNSGSFAQINSALDANTAFTDTTVADGLTYYYKTTAVNSSNEESAPTSPVQAVIPPP